MKTIATTEELARGIESMASAKVREVLAARRSQLLVSGGDDLSLVARFMVVEAGDDASAVEQALGFSPLANLVDGAAFGEPDFTPSWEWVLDHGGLFEAPFILSDDGFGWILLVLDQPGVEPTLLELLRAHAQPA